LKSDKDRVLAILTQAKQHYTRCQSLAAEDALTQDELDKANEALAVAQAGLGNSEAAITEGQKQLIVAEKTLRFHQTRLADTEISAPFNGLIVRRQRDPGDVVVPGSAVRTLVSTDELWISAWVDETEMAKIRPGQKARVVFRSDPDRCYTGKVYRLGRETDRETREFVVDVQVLELPTNWAVGQRAEVYIETGRKQATQLRPAYVTWCEGRAGVFVNVDQRAVWRPLKLGMRGRDLVEVLDGLKPGDLAIKPADPTAKLTEGRRIITP